MARPTKLDRDIQNDIVIAIRAGNYIETAAAYAGISKNTLYDWLRRGARERERLANNKRAKPRKAEQPFVEFSDAVEKALAEAEVRDVALIAKAAAEQWQAAAWRLERKFPTRWGKRMSLEHSGPEGGPIEMQGIADLTQLSEEELILLAGLLEKANADTNTGEERAS